MLKKIVLWLGLGKSNYSCGQCHYDDSLDYYLKSRDRRRSQIFLWISTGIQCKTNRYKFMCGLINTIQYPVNNIIEYDLSIPFHNNRNCGSCGYSSHSITW